MNDLLLDQGHQIMGHKHGHKRYNPQEKSNNPCRPAYMVTLQVTDLVTNNECGHRSVTTSQSQGHHGIIGDASFSSRDGY